MSRWDVGAAVALVAVGVLAVVLLWRRMVGDRPGSLAAAGAIVVAVGAAIWSYVMGQRRRVDDAEAKAEEASERERVARVASEVAAIESAETKDLTAIQVDTARDVTRIEIEGEHARATGPAAGELEAILAAYRKEHPVPMKLIDLEPELLVIEEPGKLYSKTTDLALADGIHFLCPKGCDHYVGVWFRDRKATPTEEPGPARWAVSGSSLADLTLSPSINLTGPGCGWHGWIRNGEVTSC